MPGSTWARLPGTCSVMMRTSDVLPMPPGENPVIYWIDYPLPGQLGIGPRPRNAEDVAGVDLVITVLTEEERREFGLEWLSANRLHVEDRSIPPSRERLSEVVNAAVDTLKDGGRVLVHCRAGIGRSAIVAGCILAELGMRPAESILDRIAEARGVTVPDTPEQALWLCEYVRALDAPRTLEDALRLLSGPD